MIHQTNHVRHPRCTPSRRHGQEPCHSQVLPVRPLLESTMQTRRTHKLHTVMIYSRSASRGSWVFEKRQIKVEKREVHSTTLISEGVVTRCMTGSGSSSSGLSVGSAAPRSLGSIPRSRVARYPLMNIQLCS